MAYLLSIGRAIPTYQYSQDEIKQFARELFKDSFKDIDRLLTVFNNAEINKRQFVQPLEWYKSNYTFSEKNQLYIDKAVELGVEAINQCLTNKQLLLKSLDLKDIDAIFFISSTGISTPSIDAKIMNRLPFKESTKRIPIWGLGCAGGASGLARAYEYCKAHPQSLVLVLTVELCSLTFQPNDRSKSNLVGTSLFSDGVACTCLAGDSVSISKLSKTSLLPKIKGTTSAFMKDSEDVMGWTIRNEGFFVVFSRDIPSIIKSWLRPQVVQMLKQFNLRVQDISHFLAHPGGKKVLDAYKEGLDFVDNQIKISKKILENYGNMSSVTVMYVILEYLEQRIAKRDEYGVIAALGPGFSAELLLVQWEDLL